MSRASSPILLSALQNARGGTDSPTMMLSEEQARLAVEALRSRHDSAAMGSIDVAPETLAKARKAVRDAPDVRAERVLEACTRLLTTPIDSHDLADKVISRIASDAIR